MQFAAQSREYSARFPDASFLVVLVGNQPIGRLYLQRGSDEYRVIDLSLLPDYRGGGIGRSIVQRIIDEARRTATPVRLHVAHDNPDARRLYEQLGFQQISQTDTHAFMEWAPATGLIVPGG